MTGRNGDERTRKADKGLRKYSTSILAFIAMIAAFGGAVAWGDGRYLLAGIYEKDQLQAAVERADISKTVLNIQLRQIESELFERRMQQEQTPSILLRERIQDLVFDRDRILRDLRGQ